MMDGGSDRVKQTYSDLALSAVRAALGGLAAVDHGDGNGFQTLALFEERHHGQRNQRVCQVKMGRRREKKQQQQMRCCIRPCLAQPAV